MNFINHACITKYLNFIHGKCARLCYTAFRKPTSRTTVQLLYNEKTHFVIFCKELSLVTREKAILTHDDSSQWVPLSTVRVFYMQLFLRNPGLKHAQAPVLQAWTLPASELTTSSAVVIKKRRKKNTHEHCKHWVLTDPALHLKVFVSLRPNLQASNR